MVWEGYLVWDDDEEDDEEYEVGINGRGDVEDVLDDEDEEE
jgi:hypothetical protein